MSQYYALPKFSLGHAAIQVKVLITLFTVATVLALALGLYVFWSDTGFTAEGVASYYLGNEGDPAATDLRFPMPRRELLEILHIHSFTALILTFILFHFLGLVRGLGERPKISIYVLGFVSLAGMLGSPWLVRFHGAHWASWMLVAGAAYAATCVAACLAVMGEIWVWGNAAPARADRRERA